jgi:hypothetical protein
MMIFRLERKVTRVSSSCCGFVLVASGPEAARHYAQDHAAQQDLNPLETSADWLDVDVTSCIHVGATQVPGWCRAGKIVMVDYEYA